MKQHILCAWMVSVLSLSAGACMAHDPASSATKAAPHKNAAQHKAWTRIVQKHNGSGVQMRFRFLDEPQLGQTLRLQIEFASRSDVTVSLRQDKALSLSSGLAWQKSGSGMQMQLSKPGKTIQTFSVKPAAEGLHFIYLTSTQDDQTSVASIAIKVGQAPIIMPSIGEKISTPAGEKIISMPAK